MMYCLPNVWNSLRYSIVIVPIIINICHDRSWPNNDNQPHPNTVNQSVHSIFWTPSVGLIVLAFFSTLPSLLSFFDTPVDPNPPTPRSVSVNSSTCTAGTMEICSRINWAMRSPMETSKSSEPKLKRTTPTFPRSIYCYVIQYWLFDRLIERDSFVGWGILTAVSDMNHVNTHK